MNVRRVEIKSLATYVPPRLLTTAPLEKLVDTTDEWIVTRTGIRERRVAGPDETTSTLAIYGGAPMFFYLLHLYVLKAMYLVAVAIWGANQGQYYGFDDLPMVWLWSAIIGVLLFFPTRWFAALKQRRRDIAILKYL